MNEQPIMSFEDFLLSRKIITEEQVRMLGPTRRRSKLTPDGLRNLLCTKRVLTEEEACHAFADYLGHPFVDLSMTTIDRRALEMIPSDFARRNTLIPFMVQENELSVAFSSIDSNILDSLIELTGCSILPHLATETQVRQAIQVEYWQTDLKHAVAQIEASGSLEVASGTDAIRQFSDALLVDAVRSRASDIHIEGDTEYIRVRYRIDGMLRERHRLPLHLHSPLIARFKVMSSQDIYETRMPQDGRLQFSMESRSFDVRCSFLPTNGGEKVVLRILDKLEVSLNLDLMSFAEPIHRHLLTMIRAPNGIFFVSGPTGSGKTTTCYAVLNRLNTIERNIVTIEDPIEYRFPLINQTQINFTVGLDFATVLRSVLRQDPDVVLVGEVRDGETARIAAQAALTGHLVLATIHTNTAAQTIIRLTDMGVEPYLVAPSVVGVMGQRLVRKICERCKESYVPNARERALLNAPADYDDLVLYHGVGCPACGGTGYYGRSALHELVTVNDEIRSLIVSMASADQIEAAAGREEFRPMRYDGLKKALIGVTTLSEVLRATPASTDYLIENTEE